MAVETEGVEQRGEAVFHADGPRGPWWRRLPTVLGVGALLGLLFWLQADRTLTTTHVLLWAAGGAALCGIFLLDPFPLREIRITPNGFTLVRKSGFRKYTWKDLEAARFQDYPVYNLGVTTDCFRFRVGGRNHEFIVPFEGKTKNAFEALVSGCLQAYDIPDEVPEMPSFEHILSHAGAWLFVLSILAILIAHRLAYHTLGTVFGLAFVFTGTVLAFMTRQQRLSRRVLAATGVLVAGATLIIWASGISVRDELLRWETRERRLGRWPSPTSQTTTRHDGGSNSGTRE